jgi:hypothetical protein
VFCGDGALSVETCVSAKNSPLQSRQWDRIKTSSVVEAFKGVKDGRGKVTERGKVIHPSKMGLRVRGSCARGRRVPVTVPVTDNFIY